MKDNQRIRITKKMLRESLIAFLEKKSIQNISVRELCDNAEINRTTFYKYYGSQFDLLRDIETEFIGQIENCLAGEHSPPLQMGPETPSDTSDLRLTQMLAFIEDNLALCRILLNNNVDPEFPEKLMNLPHIKAFIAEAARGQYDQSELEYLYGFIATGGQEIIKNWISKEQRESPEQLALFIQRIILRLF
jgi:AcrR family transcriptional regulator